jgi:kynurenine 3-monooxygenase
MYLDHGYKELVIPPAANGDYAMDPHNALHIWPRGDFMMIALPNPDKSYTVTLFMPWVKFNAIKNVEDVRQFFQTTFPDSIPLMPTLEHDFFANPTCHLCTVRLSPWHHKEFVVVGDAAHAVVPFFGQGMNASLEDVNILDELVTKHEGNFDLALEEFSATRPKDGNAVSDLSLRNYIEMRSEVAHSTFLWRARFERWIERYPRLSEWVLRLPWKKGDSNDPTGGFHPKYSMVSFSDIPYTELIRRNEIQTQRLDFLLYRVLPFSVVVGGAIAVPGVRRFILQVVDNITSGFKK